MAISVEKEDYLAKARAGDPNLNDRTYNDRVLAHHVAIASQIAYEAGMCYEASGNREASINNYWEAIRIGQFITRIYDADPNSHFLASWK